jgi:hypothetical protein
LLHDWIRTPLQTYLESRTIDMTGEELAEGRRRGMRLFAAHNKYTTEDWLWLLTQAGFTIQGTIQLRPHFRIFINTVDRAGAG